ncbi:hypothetical protein SXIM_27820 [Streptomyces xiamenensis]|uniref:Uncharacterized protein n=1 Tax=Streptomyces xiamenensis TaxID=408015 RepID=A0A0F7CP74_9ACTN|nr:hypothetical protein SXIM_27820 [Streptomyces xiamenensis]
MALRRCHGRDQLLVGGSQGRVRRTCTILLPNDRSGKTAEA